MVVNRSVVSFNYFSTNQTCQFYFQSDQTKAFSLIPHNASRFYFRSLPLHNASTSPSQSFDVTWTFDSSYNDQSQTFSGTPINGLTFSHVSITGHGRSLSLIASSYHGLIIPNPYLNLANRSWTFELWIFPKSLPTWADLALIGQCDTMTRRRCLHLNVRFRKLYLGFFDDDLSGTATLLPSTWYHLAFVFDCVTRNQSLYINGLLDATRTANDCYRGSSGSLTFGILQNSYSRAPFDGLIDQISYTNRSKTPEEILDDATLTTAYSFENNAIIDQGPLYIDALPQGQISFVPGRLGQGLFMTSFNYSYLALRNLVLLGTSGQPYSLSIWLQPHYRRRASIVHFTTDFNSSMPWCLTLLALTDAGNVVAFSWNGTIITVTGPTLTVNVWTHVAVTYGRSNGLRLFVNGNLSNSTAGFVRIMDRTMNLVLIGSSANHTQCLSWSDGQYEGDVDEFRLYSRELTLNEVSILANP